MKIINTLYRNKVYKYRLLIKENKTIVLYKIFSPKYDNKHITEKIIDQAVRKVCLEGCNDYKEFSKLKNQSYSMHGLVKIDSEAKQKIMLYSSKLIKDKLKILTKIRRTRYKNAISKRYQKSDISNWTNCSTGLLKADTENPTSKL